MAVYALCEPPTIEWQVRTATAATEALIRTSISQRKCRFGTVDNRQNLAPSLSKPGSITVVTSMICLNNYGMARSTTMHTSRD